jgi:hypothetical protein
VGRRLLLTIVAAGVLVAGAGAGVVNRAPVGVSGRNDTRGYSPALSIVFASPPAYAVKCCVDNDSGDWKGPRYQASDNPSLGGDSSINWSATFTRSASSSEQAARAHLVQDWADVSTASLPVPHTIAGRRVGSISGFALTTKGPGQSAQVEATLAFPLCRGLFVVTDFVLLAPYEDPTGGGGTFTVDGQLASTWNLAQAATSMQGVSVDGNLPPGRVVAHVAGRRIVGTARDCRGGPLVGVRVRLTPGGASARTNGAGAFAIPVRRPGRYRVTATLAGTSVSKTISVRAK